MYTSTLWEKSGTFKYKVAKHRENNFLTSRRPVWDWDICSFGLWWTNFHCAVSGSRANAFFKIKYQIYDTGIRLYNNLFWNWIPCLFQAHKMASFVCTFTVTFDRLNVCKIVFSCVFGRFPAISGTFYKYRKVTSNSSNATAFWLRQHWEFVLQIQNDWINASRS